MAMCTDKSTMLHFYDFLNHDLNVRLSKFFQENQLPHRKTNHFLIVH